jgi:hypothetical protein
MKRELRRQLVAHFGQFATQATLQGDGGGQVGMELVDVVFSLLMPDAI